MNLWLTPADLRIFMETDRTTGRYADAPLGSNIRAAQGFLERQTGRRFDTGSGSITLSSHGRAVVSIPDLRSVTSVTLQGATLEADASYWLLPDAKHSGVYVNVQLRAFGGDYRSNPQWFDRNLDQPWYREGSGLPNDLVITSSAWGWDSKPDELLIGVKALAAWLTKRADAALSGGIVDAAGTVFDYTQWPPEAQAARRIFMRGPQFEAV